MGDLATWLEGLGLGECHALLVQHDVDFEVLGELSDADLVEIGLSLGQRRKLLRAIAGLGAAPAPPAPPAGRAERRQVTVMFCDLVGSTQLSMRLDPEDLQDILRRSLDAISATVTRHGGYVARFMGDGMLVYFGWPQAQEDAAEQAARAGLAVVDAVANAVPGQQRLQVRVGMATGLVVVGEVLGEGAAREHVVTGATANLAARLQAAAAPDTVVIATTTRRLLGDLFELESVGPFALKGVDGPVMAWRVVAEREGESRFAALRGGVDRSAAGPAGGIIGRAAELARLEAHWAAAAAGRGRVVLLSGDAGIGKTHVVEAFAEGLAGRPHRRLRTQCLPHHDSTVLHPIANALRRAAGFAAGDDTATRAAKLRDLLAAAGIGDGGFDVFAALLAIGDVPDQGDPQARKRRTLAMLLDYLAAEAARAPLLLQLEDAHWSDPTTLEFCNRLAARIVDLPLLLIVTARPEFAPSWPDAPHVDHCPLARLAADDSTALIRKATGGRDMTPAIAELILAKTDGIPLFIEELVRELLDSGALALGEDGTALVSSGAELRVPATLQDSLTARLDRLGWVKEVVQAAAVIGRTFVPEMLAPITGLAPPQLAAALDTMVAANIVAPRATSGGYRFRHALLQDAAYSGLLHSERRRLHASAAAAIETHFAAHAEAQPELLAHHHSEARQCEAAMTWWRRAGRRSVSAGSYAEAVDQFERALAQLALTDACRERDHAEARIRSALTTPLMATSGYTSDKVRANVERSFALYEVTGDNALLTALSGQLSLEYGGSYMIRAVETGERLLAAAQKTGERRHLMFARWMLGMALTGRGALRSALDQFDAALALSDPDDDAAAADAQTANSRIAALAYRALLLHQLGRHDEATATDRQSVDEAVAGGHSVTIGLALTLRVSLCLLRRDRAALQAAAEALAALAKRQESRPLATVAGALLALLRAEIAPDAALLAEIAAHIDRLRAIGWNLMVGWLSLYEAQVALAQGRVAAAAATLAALRAIIAPRGHDFFLPELQRLEAQVAAHEGRAGEAETLLTESLAVAQGQQARAAELRAATDLARLRAAAGDPAAARALLAPLVAACAAGGECRDVAAARALLADLVSAA